MINWDPKQYSKFERERSRPFFDLVDRIPEGQVRFGADLGCGSGALTLELAKRWAEAKIWGVDKSREMLDQAREIHAPSRVHFVEADIARWRPPFPLERIVSNAALQWVPAHPVIFPRLVNLLTSDGVLAVQMPNNYGEASHRLLAETVREGGWSRALRGMSPQRFSLTPDWYEKLLRGLGCSVQIWETIYRQLLPGEDPVLHWMKGTALLPVLGRLEFDLRDEFLASYGAKLRKAYPESELGTVFPFRRMFLIAKK